MTPPVLVPVEAPQDNPAGAAVSSTDVVVSGPWARYVGDNREPVPAPAGGGGHFRLAAHLGKPLTPGLLEDLAGSLRPASLRLYLPGEDPGQAHWYACCLFLDAAGALADVWYTPDPPSRKAGVVFDRGSRL